MPRIESGQMQILTDANGRLLEKILPTQILSSYWHAAYNEKKIVQGTWSIIADLGQTDFDPALPGPAGGYVQNDTHANGDELNFGPLGFNAGTYKINIAYLAYAGNGIMEVLIGSTSLGTVDGYNGVTVHNTVGSFTYTATTYLSGNLRIKISGKNGSSSNYYLQFSRLEIITTYPYQSQSFQNLIKNGDFESWSAGASAAPNGWGLSGAGASVAREASIIKIGTYSAKVTRAGTNLSLSQQILDTYYQGKIVTFGAWVYATVASRAALQVSDITVGAAQSSYHPGDSAWHFLTVTKTLGAGTGVQVNLVVDTGDTSAYIDGAILVEGAVVPAFSPRPLYDDGKTIQIDSTTNTATMQNATTTGILTQNGANLAGTAYNSQSFQNLIQNGDFEIWTAGTTVAPDNWTLAGAGASIARDGTNYKHGLYSAAVTAALNTTTELYTDFATGNSIDYYKSRIISAGVWVKASATSRAHVQIQDGQINVFSAFHTGSGNWEFLTATDTFPSNANLARIDLVIDSGTSITVNFDGVIIVEGATVPAFSPRPLYDDGTRLNPRTSTITTSATPSPNSDTTDIFTITALSDATATFAAPSGIPVNGQKLIIRITSDASIRTLAWNSGAGGYSAGTDVPLPTATVASKTQYVGFIYNSTSSRWNCVASMGNI